jgi:Iap family predicted aminopeptidase
MGETFAASGLPIVPDRRPDQDFFLRSDNNAIAHSGIPAQTLSSFNLHSDYHQPSDITKIDFAHMASVINVATNAARILTDGPRHVWKPGGRP